MTPQPSRRGQPAAIPDELVDAMARDIHNAMIDYWSMDHMWGEIGEGWKDDMRGAVRMVVGAYLPGLPR